MKLEVDKFYHVYNRGNNRQIIFPQERNYDYFRRKITSGLRPYCDVLAYCLMPNHFHLLVFTSEDKYKSNIALNNSLGIILRSYTRAINLQENNTGSLFQKGTHFKCLNCSGNYLKDDYYPITCFHYIHQNPIRSNLVKDMEDYEFSSFREYIFHSSKYVDIEKAVQYFDLSNNPDQFRKSSLEAVNTEDIEELY